MEDVTVTVCVVFELLLYIPHCSDVRQWGFVNVDTTVTLPITFSRFFSGLSSFYTSILQTQAVSIYLTNTTIRIVANYNGSIAQGFFFSVGI